MDTINVTKLVTRPITDMANAAAHLSEVYLPPSSYGVQFKHVSMVLVPERPCCSGYMVIPEGMHAVVESNGRYVGIWPPGFHWAGPWLRVSHLVSKQFIVFESPVKECPTMDNVMVEIDISLVLHVKGDEDSLKNFVYRLGPERLDQMITAFQEEAIRTMARKKTYTKIYDLMDTEVFDDLTKKTGEDKEDKKETVASNKDIEMSPLLNKSTNAPSAPSAPLFKSKEEQKKAAATKKDNDDDDNDHREQLENIKRIMNERLEPYGVEIYSITITNVRLPQSFAREMEQATTFASKNAYAALEQSYKITVINDEEKRRQLNQKLKEDREEKEAVNQQAQAEENRLLNAVNATTAQLVAEIEENHRADILQLRTESNLKVKKLEKQTEVLKASISAKAQAEAQQILSKRDMYIASAKARGQMEIAKHRAATVAFRAQAEKVAATKLAAKREYELKMQHLRVLKNMSDNDGLTISGKNNDNILAQMLASRDAASVIGLVPAANQAPAGRR